LNFNRLGIVGLVLILFGVLLFKTEFLDQLVTSILWPLLSGSSKGKSVLLLVIMGSLLLLNALLNYPKIASKIAFIDVSNGKKYLKFTLFLVLLTYVIGIVIEVWLRLKYGVSIFTIFVSLNPDVSSTSMTHSHVFKSVLGSIITGVGETAPSPIHTGDSLLQYVSPFVYIILILFPLAYITGLLSLDKNDDIRKLILAFSVTLSLIAMIDGGLFSQPAMIGLSGLLIMYFIKEPFSPRNFIKPAVIVSLIILLGFAIEIAGTNTAYHELTVINQTEKIDMSGYNAINITKMDNRTIILIKPDTGDKETLERLFKTFKGKADGFFITWNIFSYF
jgi:hypothetical protein